MLFGIWHLGQEYYFGFIFQLFPLYSTGVAFILLDKLVPILLHMLQLASQKIFHLAEGVARGF